MQKEAGLKSIIKGVKRIPGLLSGNTLARVSRRASRNVDKQPSFSDLFNFSQDPKWFDSMLRQSRLRQITERIRAAQAKARGIAIGAGAGGVGIGLGALGQHSVEKNSAYEQGFIDKFAKLGINPEQLTKFAARGTQLFNLLSKLSNLHRAAKPLGFTAQFKNPLLGSVESVVSRLAPMSRAVATSPTKSLGGYMFNPRDVANRIRTIRNSARSPEGLGFHFNETSIDPYEFKNMHDSFKTTSLINEGAAKVGRRPIATRTPVQWASNELMGKLRQLSPKRGPFI